jgi:hypothetical protein
VGAFGVAVCAATEVVAVANAVATNIAVTMEAMVLSR